MAITQVLAWVGLTVALSYYGAPLLEKKVGAGAVAAAGGGAGMAGALANALPSLSMTTLLVLLGFFVLGCTYEVAALYADW